MSKPINVEELQARAGEVSGMMKLLSHPTRLLIACALTEGEQCVGDLEKATGASQPLVSRELARLKKEGFVASTRRSKNIFYRITDPRLEQLLIALCNAFGD